MENKNIDMTDFSPYEITEVFSTLYLDNPFVWEFLEDDSIQIYTMTHPVEFEEGIEELEIKFKFKDWEVWRSIEVYTKNIKSESDEFENVINHESYRIKKGLI